MIFSRQEKASITLEISSLFTLVTISCKLKLKTHQVSQVLNLATSNIKYMLSPVKFKNETKKYPCKIGKIWFLRYTCKTLVLSKHKQCFYKSCIYGFKLSSLRRVSSFLFNMISFKLLCDFIQVSEDFSETSKKLF